MSSKYSGNIELLDFDVGKVKDMESMFYDCSSIQSFDFQNFNTESLEDIRNMFYNCASLTSINLSNFNTERITHMSKLFYLCEKLSYVDISSFRMNSVNTALFDENLPEDGKLIISRIFEPVVKNQIPINCNITTID